MTISAVVVSHGHAGDLDLLLPLLVDEVDQVVVVANIPGSVNEVPPGVVVIENEQPRNLASNVNLGTGRSFGELVVNVNPDAMPEPGAIAVLAGFMADHPRCGIAGPRMLWPDGTWQPSRRRFPRVAGTLVRRTPLRRVGGTYSQRDHYLLDEQPEAPVEADWMLGAFLCMRRSMLEQLNGWDPGYRHYVEDIDLCYRAMRAGWERWYVPGAVVRHAYAAVIDKRFLSRHTWWHLCSMARFVHRHPESLLRP